MCRETGGAINENTFYRISLSKPMGLSALLALCDWLGRPVSDFIVSDGAVPLVPLRVTDDRDTAERVDILLSTDGRFSRELIDALCHLLRLIGSTRERGDN
jgi:hypothetical protein